MQVRIKLFAGDAGLNRAIHVVGAYTQDIVHLR